MDTTPYEGESPVYEVRVLNVGYRGLEVPKKRPDGTGGFSLTKSGLFDDPVRAAQWLSGAHGVSCYLGPNPISLARFRAEHGDTDLASKLNELHVVKKGRGVADHHVLCLRGVPIDFDAAKPQGEGNSTEEERRATIEARDAFFAAHPELAGGLILGGSGNGSFAWLRIVDLPNDRAASDTRMGRGQVEPSVGLIRSFLAFVRDRFGSPGAGVDMKCSNPARVGPVPGLLKCKAAHTAKRPRRIATLDRPAAGSDWAPTPVDLAEWCARNDIELRQGQEERKRPATGAPGSPSRPVSMFSPAQLNPGQFAARIAGAFNRIGPAISGQDGHGKTYDAACILVKGFGLGVGEAFSYMDAYNRHYCQPAWEPHELMHKLRSADASFDDRPRGYMLADDRPRPDGPGRWEPPVGDLAFDLSDDEVDAAATPRDAAEEGGAA